MKRIITFIIVAIIASAYTSAQLVGSTPKKGCNIIYPTEDLPVSTTNEFKTIISSEYVTEALVSRFVLEYPAGDSEYMIESALISVHKTKAATSSLVGTVPMKEETITKRVHFFPVDNKMKLFRASLDIGENGWDKIDIQYTVKGSPLIKKSQYKAQSKP